MFEFFFHTLGFCGENHPSLIWLIMGGGAGFGIFWTYIKAKFRGEHIHTESCGCQKTESNKLK